MRKFLAACFLAVLAVPANAQSGASDPLAPFRQFSQPLIGEWDVTIRELDETGKLLFEMRQQRTFTPTIADEFIEERVFDPSVTGGPAVISGVLLLSYDPKTRTVYQHGFFGGHAGLRFTGEASLASHARSAEGTILTPGEPGFRTRRRLVMSWQSPNEFRHRAFARDARGREFLNEELVYRRRS